MTAPDCLTLLSGTLDSVLATRIVQEQGVNVHAVHFRSWFSSLETAATQAAQRLGVPLTVLDADLGYLPLVRHPRFGRGRGVNPCLDCRIYWFGRARNLMEEIGARFVISGEVLGQKRFGQKRRDLEMIAHHAGLDGLLVRPLSARRLPPTLPEERWWLDRSRLAAHCGMGRAALQEQARGLGLEDFPSGCGGCVLTEPHFAEKVQRLWRDSPQPRAWDYQLLRVGRHFRLDSRHQAVVARRHDENLALRDLFGQPDARPACLVSPDGFPGPDVLLVGPDGEQAHRQAAALIARYSHKTPELITVRIRAANGQEETAAFPRSDLADALSVEILSAPGRPEQRETQGS